MRIGAGRPSSPLPLPWCPSRDGPQQLPVGIRHSAHNLGHQFLAGPDQIIQRDRNFHHPGQTTLELFAHVPARRRQQPLDGPVMAHQINDEEREASAPARREAGSRTTVWQRRMFAAQLI